MVSFRVKPLYVVVASAVFAMSGCLSDSKDSSGAGLDNPEKVSLTTISTAEQGAEALSAGLGGAQTGTDMGGDVSDMSGTDFTSGFGRVMAKLNFSSLTGAKNPEVNMAAIHLNKMMARSNKQLAVALADVNGEFPCDEGSIKISGSGDDTNGNFTMTFNSCRENNYNDDGYEVTTGTIKASFSATDTSESGSATFGDGDANAESSDVVAKSYSADDTLLESNTMSGKFTYDSTTGTTPVETVSATGRFVLEDNVSGDKEDNVVDNFSVKSTGDNSYLSNEEDILLNGAIQHTMTVSSVESVEYAGFSDFHYTQMQSSTDASITEETLDGKVVVDHTPEQCGDGAYNFVTSQAVQTQNDQLIAGTLTINENTTVQINSDGSIDVTVDGQTVQYANEDELNNVCLVSSGS